MHRKITRHIRSSNNSDTSVRYHRETTLLDNEEKNTSLRVLNVPGRTHLYIASIYIVHMPLELILPFKSL